MEKQKTCVTIRVKDGDREVEVSIPWSERTATFDVKDGTSPSGVLKMVEELVDDVKKLR